MERAKAKDAYRRLVVMRSIEGKMLKGEERSRAKREAARIRRDMSAKTLQQKHRVLEAMRGMKGTADLKAVQVRLFPHSPQPCTHTLHIFYFFSHCAHLFFFNPPSLPTFFVHANLLLFAGGA